MCGGRAPPSPQLLPHCPPAPHTACPLTPQVHAAAGGLGAQERRTPPTPSQERRGGHPQVRSTGSGGRGGAAAAAGVELHRRETGRGALVLAWVVWLAAAASGASWCWRELQMKQRRTSGAQEVTAERVLLADAMAALLPSAATGLASSRQCQRSRLPNQPASHYAPARCAAKPWGGPGRLPALVARSQEPGKEPGQEVRGGGARRGCAAARGVGRLPAYRRRTAPRQLPAAGLCACAQDLPPWVRREKERELQVRPLPAAQPPATPATRIGLISAPACTARTAQPAACAAACRPGALTVHARAARAPAQAAQAAKGGLPWGLSLLFSVFTTIAATGSIFEYVDRNPVFGILQVGQGQAGAGGVGARTDAAHATSPRSARAPAHCQPRLGCAHPPADAA